MDSNHGPPRYKLGALPTELCTRTGMDSIWICVLLQSFPFCYTPHYMNEFVAKKLGEVLAFNHVGSETLAKGRAALATVLGEEKILDMEERNKVHGETIVKIATDAGVLEITSAKAAKTSEKLRAMRDLYVGDQWDNATELLEWSGFFDGAAAVHWALVRGAAEALDHAGLTTLASEGVDWHYELLEMAERELHSKGADKATA